VRLKLLAEQPYRSRLRVLKNLVEAERGCALLLMQPGNVAWAVGLGSGNLLVTSEAAYLLTPPLEYLRLKTRVEELELTELELVVYMPYGLPRDIDVGGSPKIVSKKLSEAVADVIGRRGCKLLVDAIPADTYAELSKSYSLNIVSGKLWEYRMVKEWWEIERIKEAVMVVERAISWAVNTLEDMVSEADVAAEIEAEMRRLGAEDHAFPTIVAFNENTVYPHAEPSTSRRLRKDSVVLIDAGAKVKGYCSDTTRTLCYGQCGSRVVKIIEALDQAIGEVVDLIAPGARVKDLDARARKVLGRMGLDKYFIHSLGHGVGVEVHEEPRLAGNVERELKPGMVFTVEPGVYIPNEMVGARIEEVVVVTKRGARILTSLPRLL
jgi:Xaa-Pro dipeptidase